MRTLTLVLFSVTLLLCGAYAGMALFCQIGVLPAMRRLNRGAYVATWGILDGLMERSMPPYKVTLLAVSLASASCLYAQHCAQLAAATAFSFLLSLGGLVLTIGKQVPLNRAISGFPESEDERLLVAMRDQTEKNFALRLGMALLAFTALCGGIVLFPISA